MGETLKQPEAPTIYEAPALRYWENVAQQDPDLKGLAQNNQRRLELSVREGFLEDPPDPKEAREMYLRLGSYNDLEDADGLLVAGAVTLHEADSFDTHRQSELEIEGDMTLSELLEPIDITELLPDENLFYAGCMVHEAARLQSDPQERHALENHAMQCYERLVKSDLSWEHREKWEAAQQLRSLQSERVLATMRNLQSRLENTTDPQHQEELKRRYNQRSQLYMQVRASQTDDFVEMQKAGVQSGFLGEVFTEIVFARDQYESGTELEREMVSATPRQDIPRDGLAPKGYPKHSFDEVLRVYGENNKYQQYFVQVKTNAEGGDYDSSRITEVDISDYLAGKNVRVDMRQAVEAIRSAWAKDFRQLQQSGSDLERSFVGDQSYNKLSDELARQGVN